MNTHIRKIWTQHLDAILDGRKRFEVRTRTDRDPDFEAGDILHLKEWSPASKEYLDRRLAVRVTIVHCLTEPDVGETGVFVLGIEPLWSDVRTTCENGRVAVTERRIASPVFCPECAVGEFPTEADGDWCHPREDGDRVVCLWSDRWARIAAPMHMVTFDHDFTPEEQDKLGALWNRSAAGPGRVITVPTTAGDTFTAPCLAVAAKPRDGLHQAKDASFLRCALPDGHTGDHEFRRRL